MQIPEIPENEKERFENLKSYSILDTLPEKSYDDLTAIAAQICDTPIALVSLIDDKRQWFKSHHGLEATETPREFAFCAHAINDPEHMFIVADSRNDERFHDNPLVTGDPVVIFYAGVPLVSNEGYPLGTICVIDHKPHTLSEGQKASLNALSNQVVQLFTLRKRNEELNKTLTELEFTNQSLKDFAYIAAHDLKSPLNGISSLIKLLREKHELSFDKEDIELLNLVEYSSDKLKELIDGFLDYSRISHLNIHKEFVNVDYALETVQHYFYSEKFVEFIVQSSIKEMFTSKTLLDQILLNLVSNAVKYGNKVPTQITISIDFIDNEYRLLIKDNGPGIPQDKLDDMFNLFKILTMEDRYGKQGNGIGLATVKKAITHLDGRIEVASERDKGTCFTLFFPV